jgi:hypothetical protein
VDDNPEVRELWELCLKPVWTLPPECLLERLLLLKRVLERLGGPDGQLYRQDGLRKRVELLARMGIPPASGDTSGPPPSVPPAGGDTSLGASRHDVSFLEWTAWWERGREGKAPELHDSPFSSPCQTLEWGEQGRLESLRKARAKTEDRFLLLGFFAAEEICRQLAEKQRWPQVQEIARQHELRHYALLAEHRLQPTADTAARLQYRAYRVERLCRQHRQLDLPVPARWQMGESFTAGKGLNRSAPK